MKELPVRKNIRLKGYDYSQNGGYFITICVKDKHEILGKIDVGDGFHAVPKIELSDIGNELVKSINYINNHYDNAQIDKYIIMPDHVHMIIFLTGGHGNPPVHNIVGQFKFFTTKKWNDLCKTQMQELWQRNYYDHIIRNEKEYQNICQYIDENRAKWQQDKYYI